VSGWVQRLVLQSQFYMDAVISPKSIIDQYPIAQAIGCTATWMECRAFKDKIVMISDKIVKMTTK
jgi:hypothetical protein